jgi:hypothetical protein
MSEHDDTDRAYDVVEDLRAELAQAKADRDVLAAWHHQRNREQIVWTATDEQQQALERAGGQRGH